MSAVIVRENIALAHAFLALCIGLVFVRAIVEQIRHQGIWETYREELGQGQIAMATIFLSESFYRVWIWLVLHESTTGRGLGKILDPMALVSTLGLLVGTLCAIRVFSPNSWGWRGWVYSLLATALLVGANLSL